MLEYLDIKFIINTVIGTAIGAVIASALIVPIILPLLKKSLSWPGWKRVGTALLPFCLAVLFFVGFIAMLAYSLERLERLRVGRQPLYRFPCQNECPDEEEGTAQLCAELSVLHANPKRRGEIVNRPDLTKIVPENAPQPWRGRRGRERRFDGELAKDMFEACMEGQGYTTQSCVEQEPCWRVHIDEGHRPRPGFPDYRKIDLVEPVDPVVAE